LAKQSPLEIIRLASNIEPNATPVQRPSREHQPRPARPAGASDWRAKARNTQSPPHISPDSSQPSFLARIASMSYSLRCPCSTCVSKPHSCPKAFCQAILKLQCDRLWRTLDIAVLRQEIKIKLRFKKTWQQAGRQSLLNASPVQQCTADLRWSAGRLVGPLVHIDYAIW